MVVSCLLAKKKLSKNLVELNKFENWYRVDLNTKLVRILMVQSSLDEKWSGIHMVSEFQTTISPDHSGNGTTKWQLFVSNHLNARC